MRLYVRSLVLREIITGITLNWCKTLSTFYSIEDELKALKKSGHSLLIGSIFGRIEFIDAVGNKGLFPHDTSPYRDNSFVVLRGLLNSGIRFEIIGDQEELDYIKKNSLPLYDKILPHIIWKGKKRGTGKSQEDTER